MVINLCSGGDTDSGSDGDGAIQGGCGRVGEGSHKMNESGMTMAKINDVD